MPDLEPVTQKFLAITEPYVEAVDRAVEAADRFAEANIRAMNAVDLLQRAVDDFGVTDMNAKMQSVAGRADDMRNAMAGAGAATSSLSYRFTGLAGKAGGLTLVLEALDAELDKKKAALGETGLAAAGLAAAASMAKLGQDTTVAAGAARYGIGWWRLSATALHWIVAGSAEILAVVVPAMVAAGAWAAVWAQGAQNVTQHMNAVYTATEADSKMFHQTAGQAVGLGNALQKAQNAANPDVYQALGGAVNIVRERFSNLAGTGLQVGKIFDTFTAKLVYDFSSAGDAGTRLNGLMAHMVPDLTGLGQLFGNLGHAVFNFASDMPGLAEVLLRVADGISRVLLAVSGLPMHLITAYMALEEFNRWGSLAVTLMGRMGLATSELSGSFFLFGSRTIGILSNVFKALPMLIATTISSLGSLGVQFGRADGLISRAGMSLRNFGADMTDGIVAMPAWAAAIGIIAVAALGFLIYKLITAKTAAQQFAASLQKAADNASNLKVLNVLASDMGQLEGATGRANATIRGLADTSQTAAGHTTNMGKAVHAAGIEINQQRGSIDTYTAAQRQLAQQFLIVSQHASQLAAQYHTSFTGALVLADAAGVHLNQTLTRQAWAMAQIKIADLVQGYESMGQPLGVVGKDMTAVAIQSGLAATKVAQLNQAWDQFMQGVTGGTSGLAGFETSLTNMGTVVAHAGQNLAQYQGTLSLSTQQFAQQLTSFTGKGAQAWQNFNQVVGSTAPQMIDWLRQAGAEGAISGTQFTTAVRDMIAQLLPLASKSKTATSELSDLAQQAGGPATDNIRKLRDWVDHGHLSISGLSRIVSDATSKMGDMSRVAQQLGTVMQNDIIQAMDQAKLKVSGVSQATEHLLTDLRNHAPWAATHQAAQTLVRDLELTGMNAGRARQMVRLLESQWDGWNPPTKTGNFNINTYYQQHNLSPGTPPPFTAPTPPIGGHHGAAGTPSARAGSWLVGESGPEIVTMGGGERITPARETSHLLAMAAAFQAATSHGTPGSAARAAASGGGSPGVGGGPVTVHVHVAGSVHNEQSLARAVQSAVNQRTIRNGSTQLFIAGRNH